MINKWLIITISITIGIGYVIQRFISPQNTSLRLQNGTFIEIEAIGWPTNRSRSVLNYIKFGNTSAYITPKEFCTEEHTLLQIFVITAPERFIERQIIRNTWGNIDNFNYDKFKLLHHKAKNSFLEINDENWQDYIYNYRELTDDSAAEAKFRVTITFLMGQSSDPEINILIKGESSEFNDILMEDFIDHYTNMTLKSVTMLKWGTSICKENAKFIAKVDDDEFIMLPNLIHVLLGGTLPLYNDLMFYYNYKTVNVLENSNRLSSINLLAGHAWHFSLANRNPAHK